MTGRPLLIAACVAAIAAITVGLLAVGGPNAARRDRADDLRLADLTGIAGTLRCTINGVAAPLPQTLADWRPPVCDRYFGAISLIDRETGAPFRYVRQGGDGFRICAQFHDAKGAEARGRRRLHPRDRFAFDAETGCMVGRAE
jgi:hypothetical protein